MKFKNFFVGLKNKVSSLYCKNKKLFIFTLVLVCVIAFCFFSFPKTSSLTKTKTESSKVQETKTDDFSDKLGRQIEDMLLSINEVKKASVLVVCESSEINEYLKNRKETVSGTDSQSKTIEEDVAFEKDGSSSSPILITTKTPKVVGVWIVINSVSASTKLAITNSICSVLNIDESSISILQER